MASWIVVGHAAAREPVEVGVELVAVPHPSDH
jgi:hypothetical protein